MVMSPSTVTVRARLLSAVGAIGGVLLWAVPLLIASGGPTNYLAAFGSQAGEDLVGVVMLWTSPTPRVAFHAFVNAFVWPWGTLALGTVVVAIAAGGAAVAAFSTPRHLATLAVVFGPYTVFHLLLQETLTIRYALPLLAPVAYLFVRGAEVVKASPFLEIGVVTAALVTTVPQTTAFAKGSPAFAAMSDAIQKGGPIAGHAGMRRLHEWLEVSDPALARRRPEEAKTAPFMRAPHGFEWLTLVEAWRKDPDIGIQFLANPKRTDYRTLFDPYSRQATASYRWPFVEWPLLGGARPGAVERIEFSPPGWMLDRGWAGSAEITGVTEIEGYGPHRRPSVAWVRARDAASTLMIGGRHLGATDELEARLKIASGASEIAEWTVKPGFFFRVIDMPPGTLAGTGYLPLSVTAASVAAGRNIRVALEQFDLQPSGNGMAGALEGWHEPEYNRSTGRAWRWMSERAVLWVRPVGRDLTLTVAGESPLRYFDAAPTLRISIGGQELARLVPTEDFRWDVTIPSTLLERASGNVVLESDKSLVPAEREGIPDRRRLAIRVYSFAVK